MSVGLLNVGTSALLANQAALQTAGNNIANVNTPGYSRQTVVLQQVQGQNSGSGFVGKGVAVTTVMRDYSAFLDTQANLAAAQQAADDTVSSQLTQLENIFTGGSNGLGAAVSTMLNSFSAVASAPTDLTARTVALANANQMATQFRSSSASLDALQSGVQTQLAQSVTAINSLATQIAAANDKISRSTGTGQSPNDLLDQRDQLITQLNQYVQTTSIPNSDGTVAVFLAGSQALVQGTTANPLTLTPGTYPGDFSSNTLTIKTGGLSAPMDETNLGGGSLKGLMTFLNKDLAQGRNLLGRMALAIGSVVNTQHQLGLDMKGNPGGNLFQLPAVPSGLPAATNGGTANISLSVSDPTAFAVSDYQMTYTSGTAGNITRLSDGKVTAFDFATPPVQVDGLTLSASAGAVAGDRFLLKPFSTAAGQIDTSFTSPADLAVASPVVASVATTNAGGLAVANLKAQSPNANLTQSVQLTFNAATGTFNVVGTGTGNPVNVPYTPGQPISYNGWSMTLTGLPKTGDTITVGPTINVQSSAGASNTGTLVVTSTQVQTPNANLLKPVTLTFNALAGTFDVVGTGTGNPVSVPYTPGATISYNGWTMTVSGAPVTGDTLSMGPSPKNYLSTKSGNATAQVNLRDTTLFDGAPLTDGYAAAISQVGVLAQTAGFAASTSKAIATNAQMNKAAVSGVNLDEEAAKLLQFQQAYQASAKVLQIGQTIFTSLLQSLGA